VFEVSSARFSTDELGDPFRERLEQLSLNEFSKIGYIASDITINNGKKDKG
jgi:hypothetical protein